VAAITSAMNARSERNPSSQESSTPGELLRDLQLLLRVQRDLRRLLAVA
jgi:hypothetical protein